MVSPPKPVEQHYGRGKILDSILTALRESGKDLDRLQPEDLAPVDEFHVRGREATVELARRAALKPGSRVLDVGCGSGEITSRLARLYPEAQLLGVDILSSVVRVASERHAALAPRLRFQQGDAFELQLPADHCDLVVCRHLTQAVPEPARMLAELVRVCKPGGWLHVLSEDYGMLHFPFGPLDADRLWQDGIFPYGRATGTDARVGRHTWPYLRARELYKGEVSVLMLFATAGMMLLVSAGSLVMVYLGLEMLALCSYALVAVDRDSPLASEAAIKYFVLGALASGLLLYGLSLVYGATGTLQLDQIAVAAQANKSSLMLITGVVFIVARTRGLPAA